jgi:CRISPR-associated protein Cas2
MRSSGSGTRLLTFVIYDVDDDRVRYRMSETCLDYGLERIQFSAFLGTLTANERQELALRLERDLAAVSSAAGRVYMQPVCETDRAAGRQIKRGVLQADLPPEQRKSKGIKPKPTATAEPPHE